MKPSLAATLTALLAALFFVGCTAVLKVREPQNGPVRQVELMMDTIVSITAYGDPKTAGNAVEAAFEVMRSFEGMASFFKPESELARWNAERTITPTASFVRLLQAATEGFHRTDGVFDPSFAILAKAWGFYDQQGRIPPNDEIASCLSMTGWDRQILPADGTRGPWGGAITLATGSLVDLGGVAGGVAIEAAAEAMRRCGCTAFIIDEGGDLWMEGSKPDRTPWRVSVKDPRGNGSLALIETRTPLAVSTSGDYERFVQVDGKRYNHIFQMKTGRPAEAFRSVTVAAASPVECDILSTSLFAMEPEVSREYAAKNNIAAMMIPASGPAWISPAGAALFRMVNQ